MRKRVLAALLLLLTLSFGPRASQFVSSPVLKEAALPEPPMQHAAWTTPKTELSSDVVSAVSRLFEQGLADPRGCEYRKVSVGTGSCWSGDAGVADCHAWVLPAAKIGDPRYVVCWSGLVYPAVSVGELADLDADIKRIIKAEDDVREARKKRDPDFSFSRFGTDCPAEGVSISHTSLLPLKACMLLRLDRGDLAERLWKCWQEPPTTTQTQERYADPYLEFSNALLWSAFDRATCAHMRGDNNLAVVTGRPIASLRKSIEDEYSARKISVNSNSNRYLDELPGMLADDERRLKEPVHTRALNLGEKSFPDRAAWVAALIKDLDQVDARQMGQPGGVSLGWDPIIKALISCGDEAVDPLLDCLERDTRLTRSVHFWRDFAPTRTTVSVNEAAYVALAGILQTSFFSANSTGDDLTSHGAAGRKAVADNIRAYWNKYKGIPQDERWFRILADDHAGPEQWEEAMDNITRPIDVSVSPGSMFDTTWVTSPTHQAGEAPKLRGENLRSKTNPSLLDLAARRVEQIDQMDTDNSRHSYKVRSASEMALECSKFDAKQSLPLLRKQLAICKELFESASSTTSSDDSILGPISELAQTMARASDDSGLKIYADLLHKFTPAQFGWHGQNTLSALWNFQDDPAIAAVSEWMFNDPASAWNPIMTSDRSYYLEDTVPSPLLGIRSFRDQMQRELRDQSPWGTITIREHGSVEINSKGSSSSQSIESGTRVPSPGTTVAFRTCDFYAKGISVISGAPEFEYFWPRADRDAAAKACGDFLDRFGKNLAGYDRFKLQDDDAFTPTAHLTFEPLDHPATLAEANEHKAIFSLEGQGQRRPFKLADFPAKGTWITLKTHPWDQEIFDSNGGVSGVYHYFQQDSWVWQAEELNVNGEWKRFFGVVGPHEVAMVPASEIELPVEWGWSQLSHSIDLNVKGPDDSSTDAFQEMSPLPAGSPLPVHLTLRNRLGVAQALPTEFTAKLADGTPALPPDVKLVLKRAESDDFRKEGEDVISKKTGVLGSDLLNRNKVVESTQKLGYGSFDLRDFFEITQAGNYYGLIEFGEGSPLGKGSSYRFQFVLAAGSVPSRN